MSLRACHTVSHFINIAATALPTTYSFRMLKIPVKDKIKNELMVRRLGIPDRWALRLLDGKSNVPFIYSEIGWRA